MRKFSAPADLLDSELMVVPAIITQGDLRDHGLNGAFEPIGDFCASCGESIAEWHVDDCCPAEWEA